MNMGQDSFHHDLPSRPPSLHARAGPPASLQNAAPQASQHFYDITPLQEWYDKNLAWPYPDKKDIPLLAAACHMTPKQVQKWLCNKRARTNNTRTLYDIADERRRRKRKK